MTTLSDITLRLLTSDEYDALRSRSLVDYAQEIEQNFGVSAEAALERSRSQDAELLPGGRQTEGHHFLGIARSTETDGEELLGDLWLHFAEKLGGIEAFGFEFYVRPELRDAGIGRRAIQLAQEYARAQGATRLALNVFGDNARARHLYESYGFTVTSTNMVLHLE